MIAFTSNPSFVGEGQQLTLGKPAHGIGREMLGDLEMLAKLSVQAVAR
jgi:hypothetical protein